MRRYKLVLCAGEPDEQIKYANLTADEVAAIQQDIRGELNSEHLITLEGGETIDTGIIDYIVEDLI